MDGSRPDAEERHDHEPEVVIGGHIYAVAGCASAFLGACRNPIQITIAIGVLTLYRRRERIGCIGTDSNVEESRIALGNRFETGVPLVETEYHARGFILDGWDTDSIHFGVVAAVPSIRVIAVIRVVRTGGGIPDPEARGVLENDPGKQEPRKLEDADHHDQQKGKHQRKLHHGLRPGFGCAAVGYRKILSHDGTRFNPTKRP